MVGTATRSTFDSRFARKGTDAWLDRELHRICHSRIKQEEEGKFRCKDCNKLFSALKFAEKHLSTKHFESLGDSLNQVRLSLSSKPLHSDVLAA